MDKQTILCVDDEIDNLDALERIFRAKYRVLRAASGPEALKLLDQNQGLVSVIITDQRMPEMTGVEFLQKALEKSPGSVRILLTGYTDMDSVVSAINNGQIYRYLNKPWDPVDLMHTVDKAVERYLMSNELAAKNAALSKALGELQVLDQAKNQFMILINHELKTPLTSILSFVDLLRETKLDDEQALCATRIKKSAERLKELVDDVLLVVASEMKTLKLNVQPFDLSGYRHVLKEDQSKLLDKKGSQIAFQFPDKKIIGDTGLLTQVLSRLVHNSIKYGLDGAPITIKAEIVQPHRLKISVFNQGSSIPDNVREKILRPFFIDEDVMHHSTGTGLGLTVCQSILKAHGSRLELLNRDQGVEASFEIACL
ncbi:MAG: hybrid sensor histidine kinase/response regulator [Bdellovibrionaceae bacterium]|nr:hybrid sensor histidine kinase/response regulator [Pseudobdellovibrionaceae bacterium]